MREKPFWKSKTLHQMNSDEWESLCDGCGRCCLHKLEDEDSGKIHFTDVACHYLDEEECTCPHYEDRQSYVSDCLSIKPNWEWSQFEDVFEQVKHEWVGHLYFDILKAFRRQHII